MSIVSNPSITDVQLKRAAEARFCDGLPWNVCAERADISDRQLRRLRRDRDDRWLEVVIEVCEALEDEALPAAIGCLVRMTARNDVPAAKALLEKWKATRLELTGADGKPMQVEHLAHLSDEQLDEIIAAREAEAEVEEDGGDDGGGDD